MKKPCIAALALFLISLCGCSKSEPVNPPATPERSVLIADDESAPENISESSGESVPEFPVQNTASYTVTVTSYEDGEAVGTSIETYDEHDSLIKASTKYGEYYYAYEYNADGTVRVKYSETSREEYEYENGLETKCMKYDENGEIYSVMEHTYDEHGEVVSMSYEVGGYISGYTCEYEYNANGLWIKETLYDEDGELKGTSTRVLGENGEVLGVTTEDKYGILTTEHKYDENVREVEFRSTQTRDGEVTRERRVLTEYDEQGRISRKSEYRLDGGERLVSTEEYNYTA